MIAYDPFEVCIMGNEEHYPAMPFNHGKKFFLIVIFHATAKLLERHTQHLHLLQHIIADVTVELALYLPQLRFGLLGECVAQVIAYHPAPVVHNVMHQKAKSVGQHIKRPERQ